tara:strand:+ start:2755 stop:3036 length:282 start_codon:yes stop_codon:yes gene_type:complete
MELVNSMQKLVNNELVDLTQAEIDSATAQLNDYNQNVLPQEVRSRRNSLLAETDYLALSDTTLSSDMATYRQALRDVTSQAGFPTDVSWPVKP